MANHVWQDQTALSLHHLKLWCLQFASNVFDLERVPANRAHSYTVQYVFSSFGQREPIAAFRAVDDTLQDIILKLSRPDVHSWELDVRVTFDLNGGILCLTPAGEHELKQSCGTGTQYKSYPGFLGMPWAKKLTVKNGMPLHEQSPRLNSCNVAKFVLYDTGSSSIKRLPSIHNQTTIFESPCLVNLAEGRRNAIRAGQHVHTLMMIQDSLHAIQRDGGTKLVMVRHILDM